MKIKYQEKAPYDVLMAQFYGTKMEPDEKCASFGTRLEQKLNQVTLQYPNKISDTMYWNCVRERFFYGLSKCKVQPRRALLSYPFHNTAAHTEATPTREGI